MVKRHFGAVYDEPIAEMLEDWTPETDPRETVALLKIANAVEFYRAENNDPTKVDLPLLFKEQLAEIAERGVGKGTGSGRRADLLTKWMQFEVVVDANELWKESDGERLSNHKRRFRPRFINKAEAAAEAYARAVECFGYSPLSVDQIEDYMRSDEEGGLWVKLGLEARKPLSV
jgi:hypothetical protein